MCCSWSQGMHCISGFHPSHDRNSSSFLRMVLRAKRRASLRAPGLCLAGLLLGSPAWSLESDLALQQLNHKGWTAANGAPSEVVALAQTPDGTLWVGSEMGLFRFDGLSFVRYAGPPNQPFESNNVSTLATSRTAHCGSASVSAMSAFSRTVASATMARLTVCRTAPSRA